MFVILSSFFTQIYAQKKPLISDQDEIIKAAAAVFEESMTSGDLYELKQEQQLNGVYIMDITVREKGEVSNVFVVESTGGDIKSQNTVKDAIKATKMNFKMPKGKSYKFRYKFNFN